MVYISVVFPEAPKYTKTGKNTAKHTVSYTPFIHKSSAPPRRGTDSKVTIDRLHIQNAPFTLTGLKIRKRSNPAEKENNKRKEPAINSVPVNENPAHISPYGPPIANIANPQPARKTNTASARVENL